MSSPNDPVGSQPTDRVSASREMASFAASVRALTPRGFVTEGLVAANVLVYAAMVVRGVSPMNPTTPDLRAWGAGFGPLTVDEGQWWRLLTATFVHIGAIHIAMNMYVLWNAGRLVERLLGNLGFFVMYISAGLVGSIASVVANPIVTSAGASGAVFGVYGALLGFVARERHEIPREALSSLLRTGVFFVGINIMIGMQMKGIDMAAHLGGLGGGFLGGLVLAHPLTPDGAAGRTKRSLILAGMTAGVVFIATRLLPTYVK